MTVGLNSALNTAGMGMKASEKMINVIGNNLANANTVGYKSERADFADMLSYSYSYGAAPGQYNAGANPVQIGLGVVLSSVTTNFGQGTIKDGMTKTDLAIRGGGFFVIKPDPAQPAQYYTRNGVLKLNSNQQLITTDGDYVMGYGINEQFQLQTDKLSTLSIPLGVMKIAEATKVVDVGGILDAIGPDSTQGTLVQTETLADLSKSYPADETLTATQIPRPSVEMAGTTATGVTDTGEMTIGEYVYRFVYAREGSGLGDETDYSTPIPVILTGDQNSVELDLLPTGQVPPAASPPYTELRIYRAEVKQGETDADFYLVDSLTITPELTSYTDTKSTADITDPAKILDRDRLNGSYIYCVTFTDAFGGESRPSSTSIPVTVNNGRVELDNIPTVDTADNPDGWTGRNVYRLGPDNQYYLVASISSLDPDVTVVDNIPNETLVQNTQMSPYGNGSVLPTDGTKLVYLGQRQADGSFVSVFSESVLTLTANKGDTTLAKQSLLITAETTVADYLRFLEESTGTQSGGDIPLDQGTQGVALFNGEQGARIVNGKISLLGNSGSNNAISILSQTMTNAAGKTSQVSLPFGNIQEANGTSLVTNLTVYDSLGAEVNVRLSLVLESKTNDTTTYRWYGDSGDNQPAIGNNIAVGTGTITFDSHGKLIDVSNSTISVLRTDVASVSPAEFNFDMNLGAVAALATASPNVSQTKQDGAAAGVLIDYTIGGDGIITGIFSSGAARTIGQILLATFANQEGLYKMGDNLYAESMNSGPPTIGTPGKLGYGSLEQYSLEQSNADIGTELIDMILASSMYRSNAKIITTSNEMFNTLMQTF